MTPISISLSPLWAYINRKLLPISPPEKSFVEWCKIPPSSTSAHSLRLERRGGEAPFLDKDVEDFFEGVYKKLATSPDSIVDILFIGPFAAFQSSFLARTSYKQYIGTFTIAWNSLRSLTLDSFHISNLTITGNHQVKLKNCKIRTLFINSGGAELELQNTYIGKLVLAQGALKRFNMYGGGISHIDIPPPRSPNPFTGPVWFSETWFPTDRYVLDAAQPYANMRHHLRSLENVRMADLFHTLELKTERCKETWTNKVFSRLYEIFSDYGSSILRPALWLFLLGTLVSYILIAFDGAVPTNELRQGASGWQTALLGDDYYSRGLRGFYLAFYSIIHPLGVFGGQPILVASTPWLSTLLVIEGIFSATLIALMIFALRRRFKLQQN